MRRLLPSAALALALAPLGGCALLLDYDRTDLDAPIDVPTDSARDAAVDAPPSVDRPTVTDTATVDLPAVTDTGTPDAPRTCAAGCGERQSCASGVCVCNAGWGDCDGRSSNGCETWLATSESNCGACGTRCLVGQTCESSTCRCPNGQGLCGTACIDLQNNTQNCGACGNVCPSSYRCCRGACQRGSCGG